MKTPILPAVILATMISIALPSSVFAAEPENRPAEPGIGILPLDFYPKHREEL